MENISRLLFSCFIVMSTTFGFAQSSVEVSEPRVKLVNDIIHIYYDIIDGQYSDDITVSLEITNESGTVIEARSLDGDIGENVSNGYNKHITWNPSADGIFLDAQIFFEISATYILEVNEGEIDITPGVDPGSKTFSRTGLILQSLAVPGLGMSRLTGKPHWLRALAGYGCIAGSVFLQAQARDNYNSVAGTSDYQDQRDLYDTAIKQDNMSEVLAYVAIGVWIVDFVWTLVGTRDMNVKSISGGIDGFVIGGSLDPLTYTPKLKLTYKF